MNGQYLDFEKPIAELEEKIQALKEKGVDNEAIQSLEEKRDKLLSNIYAKLTAWQKVQVARHPKRPQTLDYIALMTTDFMELHGDREFKDDPALVAGLAKIGNEKILIMGQQKGRTTEERIKNNFGMMHPEGYRKALRLMKLAEKFNVPVVILIDTPGAYPGIGAEERGQAEAIARNLREMAVLQVPIVCIVTGEGASGGALGIGIGDRTFMLEFAWFSVISPEGCAAILWRDSKKAPAAADAMKITAPDLLELGVIDAIIPEPIGGAHRDHLTQSETVKKVILDSLTELKRIPSDERVEQRIAKYRKIGVFVEELPNESTQ